VRSGGRRERLTSPHTLEIAGIRFSARASPEIELALGDPRYAPFRGRSGAGTAQIDVPVELLADQGPDTEGLPLVFDSGGPWRVYRDGSDLLLDFSRGPSGGRAWLARIAPGAARATVHCGASGPKGARPVSPLHYPLDQLLTMLLLPHHGGLLLHTAGVRSGGRAVVFPGRSGAGKSTIMSLLSGRPGLSGLSDDRIVIREVDGAFRAYGTPWAGTDPVVSPDSAGLAAIAFIHQAPATRLRRIEPAEALGQLLRTASIPWFDPETMTRSLAVCEELLERTPLYELHFRKHPEVADVLAPLLD